LGSSEDHDDGTNKTTKTTTTTVWKAKELLDRIPTEAKKVEVLSSERRLETSNHFLMNHRMKQSQGPVMPKGSLESEITS